MAGRLVGAEPARPAAPDQTGTDNDRSSCRDRLRRVAQHPCRTATDPGAVTAADLPGVRLGCCAAGAGEDRVDRSTASSRRASVRARSDGALEMVHRPRPDDGARDAVLVQQATPTPRLRVPHRARRTTSPTSPAAAAACRSASTRLGLLRRDVDSVFNTPPSNAARQRAPRDHADAVVAARGQHLELDRAHQQVVVALLADQPERTCGLLARSLALVMCHPAKLLLPT